MSLIKKLFKTNFADRLCQCEYQNAVKKCPIATRLLTAALHLNTQIKLFINWSDTKSKNKETTLVCLEHFYELFTTEDSFGECIIWSAGHNSEFKVVVAPWCSGYCCCITSFN